MKTVASIGESHAGCDHFKLGFESKNSQIHIELLAHDPNEKRILREHLYLDNNQPIVFENDKAIIPLNANVYFDGKQIASYQNNAFEIQRLTLPEIRMIAEYNDTKTNNQSEFYEQLTQHIQEKKSHKRIDGHTHYVAAFSMKNALEKTQEINRNVYIPNLVVLKILKDKGIMTPDNKEKWLVFLEENKSLSANNNNFRQKDASYDLINEDFVLEIPSLDQTEKEFCIQENKAYYIDLEVLKSELNEDWGEFCNGFDLPATHSCDFTEHMEMVYNLRNWFGKDTTFLEAQLEEIYEAYEKQGIDYAEIPAGYFKKQEDLNKFVQITQSIENRRASENKPSINLRPGLSIARLMEPSIFRKILFSYIPMIAKNPALASITVLAHETNPTTEHLKAIRDFTRIINTVRPGFTIEVHAGETSAYGEINMAEARSLALHNKLVVVRAGHASYGSHLQPSMDNFIEEKCPLSNLTLIDIEPEVHVNVLLGISEGKTNMFWGSDGAIYNPLYSPDKQEHFYMQLMSHPSIEQELKQRFDQDLVMNRFGAEDFKSYKEQLAIELSNQLERNRINEEKYIHFKQCEKDYYELKINIMRVEILRDFSGVTKLEELSAEEQKEIRRLMELYQDIKKLIHYDSFSAFENSIIQHHDRIKSLNHQCEAYINSLVKNVDVRKFIDNEAHAFLMKSSLSMSNRNAVEIYYKFSQIMPLSFEVCMAYPTIKAELDFFALGLANEDVVNDVMNQLKEHWKELKTFKYNNSNLNKEENVLINKFIQKVSSVSTLINTAYSELHACIDQTNKENLSEEEINKLNNAIWNVNIEDIETDKLIVYFFIEKMPMPVKSRIFDKCEVYLDPNYYYNQVARAYHENNSNELKSKAFTIGESEKKDLFKNAVVLFGSPEYCDEASRQQEYMTRLYQNIYAYLENQIDNGIILLGNVYEGINPLVYQVIEENLDKFEDLRLFHVVSPDENINNLKNKTKTVPYIISGKSRQECHIAYADFIQKNEISNIIMFGGKAATWSDTKNALADRKLPNNDSIGQIIQFYPDGFETVRSSSAFVKGAPNQCCKLFQHSIMPREPSDLLSEKYYEQFPKTSSYHKNLQFAFLSMMDLLSSVGFSTKAIDLQHFLAAYNPHDPELFKSYANIVSPEEGQQAVINFFVNFLNSEKATLEVLLRFDKALGQQDGFGVDKDMQRNFPMFSLSLEIQERIKILQEAQEAQDAKRPSI